MSNITKEIKTVVKSLLFSLLNFAHEVAINRLVVIRDIISAPFPIRCARLSVVGDVTIWGRFCLQLVGDTVSVRIVVQAVLDPVVVVVVVHIVGNAVPVDVDVIHVVDSVAV